MDWCVYVVRCVDDTLYTGYTNSIMSRIKLHNLGKGAKYTRGRGPVALLCYWVYDSKSEAMSNEYKFKRLVRNRKLCFIDSPTDWIEITGATRYYKPPVG